MTEQTSESHRDPHRALDEPSRARIYELVAAAEHGLDATELADASGLHPNTVRWHLHALADAGLVASHTRARKTPGRPRVVYEATSDTPAERENYRLLAGMLASTLARSPDGGAEAEAAGEAWGAHLVPHAPPFSSGHAGTAAVVRLLADEGFRPELEGSELRMHRCPFHELALEYGQVVCRLHLGLLRGALAESRADVEVDSLDVFPSPNLCVAHLRPAARA